MVSTTNLFYFFLALEIAKYFGITLAVLVCGWGLGRLIARMKAAEIVRRVSEMSPNRKP
jgi:hypothetical protein